MIATLTRAHFGRYLLAAPGHWSATFEPGRRTLTAATNRRGELRAMTAAMMLEYLGADREALRKPYDRVELDDRGIFGQLTPVDISQQARWCYNLISQPARVLLGACALETRKENRE